MLHKLLTHEENKIIRTIYHLSDIHIRNINRHAEYEAVFKTVYKVLVREAIPHQSVIVITGDILHAKTEMSPESFSMTHHFLKNLTTITDVIIIAGNHDCNLSNRNRLDALTPIVASGAFNRLYYLKESAIYQYHNIFFGVTSIYDQDIVRADAIDPVLWNGVIGSPKYKIALYHGPVHKALTDVGYRMNNKQLLASHFDGYHYVLLGDIHKFQYLNDAKTIAYAGSLIQQSHGESLENHGILRWDLLTGNSQLIPIKNDYGYCTVQLIDGQMIPTRIPLKPRIKFVFKNTNPSQYETILNQLQLQHQIMEIRKDYTSELIKTRDSLQPVQLSEQTIIDYLTTKVPANKVQPLLDLHHQFLRSTHTTGNSSPSTVCWKMIKLTFSNMLSYGSNNVIHFQKYAAGKIIGIVAPNYYGKSAILDIILFCLFDKFTRGDRKDILNKNKNTMSCKLTLEVGSTQYVIARTGERTATGSVKIVVQFYTKTNKQKISHNGLDRTSTNKKIVALLGDYHHYLATCFCLQGSVSPFIDMSDTQKKEYLHEIFKLATYEQCHAMAKDKAKELTGALTLLEQSIVTKCGTALRQKIINANEQNAKLTKQIEIINDQLEWINDCLQFHQPDTIHYTLTGCLPEATNEPIILDHIESTKTSIDVLRSQMIDLNAQKTNLEKEMIDLDQLDTWIKKREEEKQKIVTLIVPTVNRETVLMEHHQILLQLKALEQHATNDNLETIYELIAQLENDRLECTRLTKPVRCITVEQLQTMQEAIALKLNVLLDAIENNYPTTLQLAEMKGKLTILKMYFPLLNSIKTTNNHSCSCQLLCDQWWEWSKTQINQLIDETTKERVNIDILMVEITHLQIAFRDAQLDWIDRLNQQSLTKKQTIIETKLNELILQKTNLIKINQLKEKQTQLEKELADIDRYVKDNEQNKTVYLMIEQWQLKIDALKDHINWIKTTEKQLNEQINTTNIQLIEQETKLNQWYQIYQQRQKLEMEQLHLMFNDLKQSHFSYWSALKNAQLTQLTIFNESIIKNRVELALATKEWTDYLAVRQQIETLLVELDLHQLYVQLTHYNGIPHQIIKQYLPFIENNINKILQSMADFTVHFVFDQNELAIKSTKIDLHICHHSQQSYSTQLASGFEKFIVGLAIRISFSQLSCSSKPSFLIIDEGWSCFDSVNLQKIDLILNFLRSEYEQIIIISHLEELKIQSDYTLNIQKIDGYSVIKNQK